MSLRNQLLAVLSALFMAVLVAILVVSVSGTRRYLEQQLASHAQDAATAMSVTLGQSLGRGDLVLAEAQVVMRYMQPRFFAADTCFIREGDAGDNGFMALLIEGDVVVERVALLWR